MTISELPELDPGIPERPRRRVLRVAAAITAVAALVAGGVAASTSGADDPSYRTATAAVRDVEARFTTVATIEPVSQASVGFPVAGTVATVSVAVGDTVTVGQTLATLDTASLEQSVRSRRAELDQANLALSSALAGEPVSPGPSSGESSAGSSNAVAPASTTAASATVVWASGTTSPVEGTAESPAATAVEDAQLAVVETQRAVESALRAADAALATADDVCDTTSGGGTGTTTSTTTAAPSTTAPSTAAPSTAACLTALAEVRAAQQSVATAQQQLVAASDRLTTLLDEQAASNSSPAQGGAGTGGTDTGGTAPSASAPTSPSESGSGTSAGSTATAEQLIALQRTVSATELQLAVAQQAVDQATIVSPVQGTVVANSFEVGQVVTAGSSTDHVMIDGELGFEATTTVGVDDVADIELGQHATLRPDGSDTALDAEVVSIDLVGDGSDGTYRITAALTGADDEASLKNGATGTLTIVTRATTEALAVPTSAVTLSSGSSTVTVLDAEGTATSVTVRVGVVGAEWTEILDGIEVSTTVVLADLDEPLPGAATEVDEQPSGQGADMFPGGGQGGVPSGGSPSGGRPSGGPPGS